MIIGMMNLYRLKYGNWINIDRIHIKYINIVKFKYVKYINKLI